MRNKRGASISIVLLVVLTLILSAFTLFTFYSREKTMQGKLYSTRFLENLYAEEELINFYLQEIFDKTEGTNTEEFKASFKEKLEEYKVDGVFIVNGLEQAEEQLDKIGVEEGKASVVFEIELEDEIYADGRILFEGKYVYHNKLEKEV